MNFETWKQVENELKECYSNAFNISKFNQDFNSVKTHQNGAHIGRKTNGLIRKIIFTI